MVVDYRAYSPKTATVQAIIEMFRNEGLERRVAAPCNPRVEGASP